jgi:hypothetical protein
MKTTGCRFDPGPSGPSGRVIFMIFSNRPEIQPLDLQAENAHGTRAPGRLEDFLPIYKMFYIFFVFLINLRKSSNPPNMKECRLKSGCFVVGRLKNNGPAWSKRSRVGIPGGNPAGPQGVMP